MFAPFWEGFDFSFPLALSLDPEGDGLCCVRLGRTSSLSSMMIPAFITSDHKLFLLDGIVPYLL